MVTKVTKETKIVEDIVARAYDEESLSIEEWLNIMEEKKLIYDWLNGREKPTWDHKPSG